MIVCIMVVILYLSGLLNFKMVFQNIPILRWDGGHILI